MLLFSNISILVTFIVASGMLHFQASFFILNKKRIKFSPKYHYILHLEKWFFLDYNWAEPSGAFQDRPPYLPLASIFVVVYLFVYLLAASVLLAAHGILLQLRTLWLVRIGLHIACIGLWALGSPTRIEPKSTTPQGRFLTTGLITKSPQAFLCRKCFQPPRPSDTNLIREVKKLTKQRKTCQQDKIITA